MKSANVKLHEVPGVLGHVRKGYGFSVGSPEARLYINVPVNRVLYAVCKPEVTEYLAGLKFGDFV
jgi:hypothetical protein